MSVQFNDNSEAVKEAIEEALSRGLAKAASTLHKSVTANSNAKYSLNVDREKMSATISTNENEKALAEEYGKGEYAVPKKNRLNPDEEVQAPTRPLQTAFVTKQNEIKNIIGNELNNL